jgi:hypothetical protein
MDASTDRTSDPDAIRERVERKRDEFAGGPEPGWQALEAAVDDTRTAPASYAAGSGQAAASGETWNSSASPATVADTAGQSSASTGATAGSQPVESDRYDTENLPFNDEHPLGVGQQCFKCGAYNDFEAESCWNCSSELTRSVAETPGVVESVLPTEGDDVLPSISTGDTTSSGTTGAARPISPDGS